MRRDRGRRQPDPLDPPDEPPTGWGPPEPPEGESERFGGQEPSGAVQAVFELEDGKLHRPLLVDLSPIEVETEQRVFPWLPWPTRTRTVKLEVPPHPKRPLLDPETGVYLLPEHARGEKATVHYGVDWGCEEL